MRLLNVHSFQLERYDDIEETPDYATLSHRWSNKESRFVNFHAVDWHSLRNSTSGVGEEDVGIAKILSACAVTRNLDLDYLWVSVKDRSPI